MKIQVTAEDIRNGQPCRTDICPVALAVERAIGKPVCVECATVAMNDGRLCPLPDEVTEFIDDFDNESTVQPIEFELPDINDWELPDVDDWELPDLEDDA